MGWPSAWRISLVVFLEATALHCSVARGGEAAKGAAASLTSDQQAVDVDAASPTSDTRMPAEEHPAIERPVESRGGLLFENDSAKEAAHAAREFDPLYCPIERRDRDRTIALYRDVIAAQPRARSNAAIADRIAQLYAFYADRAHRVTPDFDKAADWWSRCVEWSNPRQLLWAQAQMGLASTASATRDPASSVVIYDMLLEMDAESIELDDWQFRPDFNSPAAQARELANTRQRFRDLQAQARKRRGEAALRSERKAQFVATGALEGDRRQSRAKARDSTKTDQHWGTSRKMLLVANAVCVVVLALVALRRRVR